MVGQNVGCMPVKYVLAAIVALAASVPAALGQAPKPEPGGGERSGEPKAVIELFTSQGCSSCPAADKLLGELAANPALLAMSEPIDYWDYLGWKDTLARPRHTARQRGYALMRSDREVYTPQVVVNGTTQVLGSDAQAIAKAVAAGGGGDGAAFPVTVRTASRGEGIEITATADGKASAPGEVWLCAIAKAVPVAIRRGENRGRTVTYHNVVRRWVKLGDWPGRTQSWTVNRSDFQDEGIDTIAVLVQSGAVDKPGRILGAAVASLR